MAREMEEHDIRQPTRWAQKGKGGEGRTVTLKDDLVLLGLGLGNGNTLEHGDLPNDLLTEEVSDGEGLSSLTDDAVDGEMGVDGPHLVLEPLYDRTPPTIYQDRPTRTG